MSEHGWGDRSGGPGGPRFREPSILAGADARDYLGMAGTGAAAGMTSVSRAQRRLRDTYSADIAEQLAEEYSFGRSSLLQLHESDPYNIPPPMVIRRWRDEKPTFDALMGEAERARAMVLAESTIELADDVTVLAAITKNRITARLRNAEILDRDRMGVRGSGAADRVGGPGNAVLTRAQLIAIAMGKVGVLTLDAPGADDLPALEPAE